MNKFTKVLVTAAVITTATLSAIGTAYAQDSKTQPGGRGCMMNNVYYLDGAVYTSKSGDKVICNDGTWVAYFDTTDFPNPCCKAVDAIRKSISVISRIVAK